MPHITRRQFINASISAGTVAGVAHAAGPLAAVTGAAGAVLGANEKVRVGLIGCGGMGRGDLAAFLANGEVHCPVVCDVDDAMLAQAVKQVTDARGKAPETVKDFRRVIDRDDVDACIVGTPDHWHALPTIYACQAGKDVYVEKPLATSIGEGRAMLNAARRHQRVVQMGTQWRSGQHWGDAVRYVQSGRLGKLRLVRCWAYLNWVHSVGKPADAPVPKGVDYDMWLGPAPQRPFNPARFHFSFRWFWDYAGGLMTDWAVHLFNIALWATDPGFPLRVSCSGGKYIYDDISDTPDTQLTQYDFPGFTLVWEHQMSGSHGCEGREHGVAFHGTEGTLIVDNNNWQVVPERPDRKARNDDSKPRVSEERHESEGDARPAHVRNFLDCLRSREQPVENPEVGHRVSTVAHLGNIALLTKRAIRWDADREQVIDDDEANALVTRPYRKPWTLPA